MTDIAYNPARARVPDVSEYHRVTDWNKLMAALGMPLLGFKVGNGWVGPPDGPFTDPTWELHFHGAEDHNLVAVGYWFGAQRIDDFLRAFPPKEGRIPCLDFEFPQGHVITPKDASDAVKFVDRLKSEWGRWPWFYGHGTWNAAGAPAGTSIENCPYWGPTYGSVLVVPRGIGRPVAHQYAASSRGPKPWHFAGVADGTIKGADGLGIGPDMNSMLVPFSVIKEMAGIASPPPPGGGFVLKDEDAQQLGFAKVSDWRAQEERSKAVADVLAGRTKRTGQDAAYNQQYDATKAKLGL